MKAKLKKGAVVLIEHSQYTIIDNTDIIFEVRPLTPSGNTVELIDDGYGSKENYGNGSILTFKEHIEVVE